jgi:hypothetical protein
VVNHNEILAGAMVWNLRKVLGFQLMVYDADMVQDCTKKGQRHRVRSPIIMPLLLLSETVVCGRIFL